MLYRREWHIRLFWFLCDHKFLLSDGVCFLGFNLHPLDFAHNDMSYSQLIVEYLRLFLQAQHLGDLVSLL